MNKKILFVTYGGGHVNIVKEIVLDLKKRKEYQYEILALTVAFKVLNESKLPYKKISDYLFLFEDIKDDITLYGQMMAQTAYNPESGIDYVDSVTYLGLNLYDLVKECGNVSDALKLYNERGMRIFNPKDAMRRILNYEKPDLVVLTAGVRMEKGAGIAANQLGIPVVLIWDLPEYNHINFMADVCVMNQYSRDYLFRHINMEHERVHVTGHPVFEKNLVMEPAPLENVKRLISSEKYKNKLLFLLQPGEPYELLLKVVYKMAENHKQDLFLIKLHPNQALEDVIIEEKQNVRIVRDVPVKYLIYISTLALTYYSTAGLEAALMGKDVIVINTDHRKYSPDYHAYGIAERVENYDDLEYTIYEKCFQDIGTKKRLEQGRQLFRNEENATANIIRVFDQILREKK